GLGFMLGLAAVAGVLELAYYPDRLGRLAAAFATEAILCAAALLAIRGARLRRFVVPITSAAAFAIVGCMTLYVVWAGASGDARAARRAAAGLPERAARPRRRAPLALLARGARRRPPRPRGRASRRPGHADRPARRPDALGAPPRRGGESGAGAPRAHRRGRRGARRQRLAPRAPAPAAARVPLRAGGAHPGRRRRAP